MNWFDWAKKHLTKWKEQAATAHNFTPRAQQILTLAREEADRLKHNYIGTEHVLLGLIKFGRGVAVNVLHNFEIDLESIRREVEKVAGTGPVQNMSVNIPYTPRMKKVLALARKNADALHHTYVGTEHLLLGLLEEGEGIAAQVLKRFEVDLEQARKEIIKELMPILPPDDSEPKQQG